MGDVHQSLEDEWKSLVEASPEVKRSRLELERQRIRIRDLTHELEDAEVYLKQLESRKESAEDNCKPLLLKYSEHLDEIKSQKTTVSSALSLLVEELLKTESWERVISVTKLKVSSELMRREEILAMLKIVLHLRDGYLNLNQDEAVNSLQDISRRLLRLLGSSSLTWRDMKGWEARILVDVVAEVEGVPTFVRRFVDETLNNDQRVLKDAGVQTQLSDGDEEV